MAMFDTVIKDGMVVDGTGATKAADRCRHRRRAHRPGRPHPRLRRRPGHRRPRARRRARVHRPAHPLRRAGLLGSVPHHVGLARRHVGGYRQLRVRFRAGAAEPTRTIDAVDDRRRGDPHRDAARRTAVGLGEFPEYLDAIERTPLALNVLPYMPVNPLLVWVLGLDAAKAGKKPTDEENREIARLLDEALTAGACGWSAQCLGKPGEPDGRYPQGDFDGTPMPSDIMWPDTRRVLAQVLGVAQHRVHAGVGHTR